MSLLKGKYVENGAIGASKINQGDTFTWTGSHSFTDASVTVPSPSADGHPATKAYVDNTAIGLKWRAPVKVRAQGNIDLSAPGATIDGETMQVDDRFLCDQQSPPTQDGIYLWKGASTPPVRSLDAASGSDFSSASMFVQKGTDADKAFNCTNDYGSAVIGTDDIVMVAFAGSVGAHALGGSSHTADTLANLNSKVSDGVLVSKDNANTWTKQQTVTPSNSDAIAATGAANASGSGWDGVVATGGASSGSDGAGGTGIQSTGGAGNGSGAGGYGGEITGGVGGVTGDGGIGSSITGGAGGATSGNGGDGASITAGYSNSGAGGVGVTITAGDGGGSGNGGIGANIVGGNADSTGAGGAGVVAAGGDGGITSGIGGNGGTFTGGVGTTEGNGGYGIHATGGDGNGDAYDGEGVYGLGGGTAAAGVHGKGATNAVGVIAEGTYTNPTRGALKVMAQGAVASAPTAGELQYVSRLALYTGSAWRNLDEESIQEMHKVTSGEVTAGYFTLANSAINAKCVKVTVLNGFRQVNKQCVGSTGVTPDFDVISPNLNRVHINNNGGASGLSGDITTDDVLFIDYHI